MKKLLMLVAMLVAVSMVGKAFAGDTLVPDFDMDGDHHGNPGDYDGDRGDSGNDGSDGENPGFASDSDHGNGDKNVNVGGPDDCESRIVSYGYESACIMLPRCCKYIY